MNAKMLARENDNVQAPLNFIQTQQGWSRRTFLWALGLIAALLGMMITWQRKRVSNLISSVKGHTEETLSGLTALEFQMLPLISEAIVAGAPFSPPEKAFFAQFLASLPLERRRELNLGLGVLDCYPLKLGHLKGFSSLNLSERQKVLHALENENAMLFPLFLAVKELSYLEYYRKPEIYSAIQYQGPIVASDDVDQEVERGYAALVAPPSGMNP